MTVKKPERVKYDFPKNWEVGDTFNINKRINESAFRCYVSRYGSKKGIQLSVFKEKIGFTVTRIK